MYTYLNLKSFSSIQFNILLLTFLFLSSSYTNRTQKSHSDFLKLSKITFPEHESLRLLKYY